jgi:hypothetical protein
VAESADAPDLKSVGPQGSWGFNSPSRHFSDNIESWRRWDNFVHSCGRVQPVTHLFVTLAVVAKRRPPFLSSEPLTTDRQRLKHSRKRSGVLTKSHFNSPTRQSIEIPQKLVIFISDGTRRSWSLKPRRIASIRSSRCIVTK